MHVLASRACSQDGGSEATDERDSPGGFAAVDAPGRPQAFKGRPGSSNGRMASIAVEIFVGVA